MRIHRDWNKNTRVESVFYRTRVFVEGNGVKGK